MRPTPGALPQIRLQFRGLPVIYPALEHSGPDGNDGSGAASDLLEGVSSAHCHGRPPRARSHQALQGQVRGMIMNGSDRRLHE